MEWFSENVSIYSWMLLTLLYSLQEYEHREETCWKPAVEYARRRYSNVDSPDAKAWRLHTYPVTRSATSSLTGEESPVEADEPVRNGHWLADLASADTELPGESPSGPSPASEPIGNGVTPSQTTESPIVEHQVPPNVKIREEDEGALGPDSEAVVSLLDSCDSDAGDDGGGSGSSPGGEEALERADGDSEDPSDPAQAAPADSLVTMWPFVQVVDGTSDSAAEQPCQIEETERTAVPSPRRVITVHPTRYRGGRVQYVPNPAVSGSGSTGPQSGSRTVTVQRGPAAPVVHMTVVRPSPVTQVKVVRPSSADDAEVKRLQEELDWLRRQLADGNRQVRVWRGLLSREASRLGAPCTSDVDEEPQASPILDGEDQPMASDDSENDDTEMPAPAPTSVTCTFPLNKFPVLPAERSAAEAAHRLAIRQMARLQVSAMRDKVALRRAQLRLLEHRLEARLARQRRRRRLASLLTPAQCFALEGSAPQCWPKEDVQRAVQLRSACGKEGYRWLQRRWKLPLPPLFSLPLQTAEADDNAERQGTGNGPVECADDVKTEEF